MLRGQITELRFFLQLAAACLLAVTPAWSEAAQPKKAAAAPVAATVNGEPILKSEVDGAVATATQGKQINAAALPILQAEVLAQLIDRTVVEEFLKKDGMKVNDADVDAAIERIKVQLGQQKVTMEQMLAQRGTDEAGLRRVLAWQILWDQFVQKYLTDQNLKEYFRNNHREFDGTELRVSHILLRSERSGDPTAAAALVERAKQLREQIETGKITFAEAVKKYSAGPSKARDGDLGFIPRHGLMVEQFSQAAFALKKGQVSQPVVTPFGVHLIQAGEEKPGDKTWIDVRDQLKPPAAQLMFDFLARREREKAKIEFTGLVPHMKPGTRELETTTPEPTEKK